MSLRVEPAPCPAGVFVVFVVVFVAVDVVVVVVAVNATVVVVAFDFVVVVVAIDVIVVCVFPVPELGLLCVIRITLLLIFFLSLLCLTCICHLSPRVDESWQLVVVVAVVVMKSCQDLRLQGHWEKLGFQQGGAWGHQ